MYEIVENFVFEYLIGTHIPLGYILIDVTIVLIYVALVMFVIWMFKVASRIIKL